ncbi:MAG: hypothetical protein F4226_06070 [Synechococcus sp. SB0678_bin_12]|nr:hypothetical protein [Synechococcus sp. SB0678_bin_12]
MPAIPHSLIEWLALFTQPAVNLLGVGLYVNLLNKRIDELKDDMKEVRQDVKTLLLQQAAKQPVHRSGELLPIQKSGRVALCCALLHP